MSVVSDKERIQEMQLMITELQERHREVNTTAASHHKQLHEQDRQRVLSLEKRCTSSAGEEPTVGHWFNVYRQFGWHFFHLQNQTDGTENRKNGSISYI